MCATDFFQAATSNYLSAAVAFSTALLLVSLVYARFFYVDFPAIRGIPEIPGATLLYGHLPLLGDDHASTAQEWAEKRGWPVYQLRLGYKRVVVINGFEAARSWLISNQASTADRPLFYTFHKVVSKTSASTIGTNPWNERTKKQRRVVGSLTTAPAIKRLSGMLDVETTEMVRGILRDGRGGSKMIMPHIYQKMLSLNIMLMFCYGRRFDNVTDPLLLGILRDASVISTFRSTNANAQDYVPHLRYMGFLQDKKRTAQATEVRVRRDEWLAALLQEAKDNIASGKPTDCVAAGLLTDTEQKLTKYDIRTVLGGLMSGGFETVISTAIAGIAYLASPAGQATQDKIHADLLSSYGSAEAAFAGAVHEEKSRYTAAFVREVLRHYPPLHLLPPRQTYREFTCGDGVTVPKGVMVLVNCQAVNHDPSTYGSDASSFRPERWLDTPEKQPAPPPPYHLSFGAGARMCTAVNFSNRVLYAAFVRLVAAFRIEGEGEGPCVDYVDYNRDTRAQSAMPKDFKAAFEIRDRGLQEWLAKAGEAAN